MGQPGKPVVFALFHKKSRAQGRGQSDREEVIQAKEDNRLNEFTLADKG